VQQLNFQYVQARILSFDLHVTTVDKLSERLSLSKNASDISVVIVGSNGPLFFLIHQQNPNNAATTSTTQTNQAVSHTTNGGFLLGQVDDF
jgi:hypothetical protein